MSRAQKLTAAIILSLSSRSKTHSVGQQERNPRPCLPDLRCWHLNWSVLSLQGFCCEQRKQINTLLKCSGDGFASVWMNLHENKKINSLVSRCCACYSMLFTHPARCCCITAEKIFDNPTLLFQLNTLWRSSQCKHQFIIYSLVQQISHKSLSKMKYERTHTSGLFCVSYFLQAHRNVKE